VRFANVHSGSLLTDQLVNQSLAELGLVAKPGTGANSARLVKVCRDSTPTVDAFYAMQRQGLSCVAIVDNLWRLVGNLSASDVTVLTELHFIDLVYSTSHFLNKMSTLVYKYKRVIAVDPQTSLRTVLHILTQNCIHHVWVVDTDDRPLGLVTLTDILALILTRLGENRLTAVLAPASREQLRDKQHAESERTRTIELERLALLSDWRDERHRAQQQQQQRAYDERITLMQIRMRQREEKERAADEASERITLMRIRIRQREEKERAADEASEASKIVSKGNGGCSLVTPLAALFVSSSEAERLALIAQRMCQRLTKEHQLEDEYRRREAAANKTVARPAFVEEV